MTFLMSKRHTNTIEIMHLPPETDELTLRKMLTSKLSQNMDEADLAGGFCSIEMSKVIDGGHSKAPEEEKIPSPRENRLFKKQTSYQLSFRSSAEMHSAIKLL